ncbi:peptidylprolyl isomerase SurA [Idiomarina sp. OT37-5b]|jgi:peptidyl-prolyl cis-trans isomerase SurA|uniref:Chaperone SurA n=1 Tax=Idiomarina aquatica TaxID=1327752 RepID=A0AA94EDV9_9GAMM|nr:MULTISPECIES: peptidylprolyl isomerase SurA [Idiomarina]AVJ56876.1 peptidylprolyl isomerase SurA [Idiomarina sp. OT37-5b]RUO42388.1 peptidylprolyl isomerase SurA [Idiomarina aquatica]
MKYLLTLFLAVSSIAVSGFIATPAKAQETLDRVAVIVDEGVILQSQIEQMMQQVKSGGNFDADNAPSDQVLETQVTERLILQELQLQMAERMGVEIGESQLEQAIDGIAKERDKSVEELRAEVTASGISWPTFREQIRNELIISQVERAAVQRRVSITPQEVGNLVELIENNSQTQTEYRLSQILIASPSDASQEEQATAKRRADAVMKLLNEGEDFSDLAIRSSSGSNALDGGDLGWMTENTMPTLFADVVKGKDVGAIVGPLRSGVGFHILKVADKRGEQKVEVQEVKARHILIKPSVILSDKRAQEMLNEFRQQVESGEKTFDELAREHSADPGSASRGGDLGWSRPDRYAPEFKQTVETIEQGVISEPFRTQFGWHIVEVTDRRTLDATQESKQDRAYQMLFARKYREELDNWQQEIRDRAYVRKVVN